MPLGPIHFVRFVYLFLFVSSSSSSTSHRLLGLRTVYLSLLSIDYTGCHCLTHSLCLSHSHIVVSFR